MGNFYVNITTRKVPTKEILDYLTARNLSAFVIEGPDDYCTLYEELCDEQDTQHISSLLKEISSKFSCPAIGMLNHDDDVLAYELWANGSKVDEYDSCPGYFNGDEKRFSPEGGDPRLLVDLLGNGENIKEVESVLNASEEDDGGFVFAYERHQALAEAIGLPTHSVGFGFRYISQGEIPFGINADQIMKTDG